MLWTCVLLLGWLPIRAETALPPQYLECVGAEPTNRDNVVSRLKMLRQWQDALDRPGVMDLDAVPLIVDRLLGHLDGLTPQHHRLVDQLIDGLATLTHSGDQLGRFRWSNLKEHYTAGEMTTLTVTYEAGPSGLHAGEEIWLGIHSQHHTGAFEFGNPGGDGYVRIEAPHGLKATLGNAPIPTLPFYMIRTKSQVRVVVTEGSLKPGEKMTMLLGDTSGGGRGFQLTRRSGAMTVDCYVQLKNKLHLPVDRLRLPVAPGAPCGLDAIVPSVVDPGARIQAKLRLFDQYRNIARGIEEGVFTLFLQGERIAETTAPLQDGTLVWDGIAAPASPGVYRYSVIERHTRLQARSNPIRVSGDARTRIYWGDLHGHTELTDGISRPGEYFRHARDGAFLDVVVLTDHDILMSPQEWAHIVKLTRKSNEAGAFVTFCGYEWTQQNRLGGHHNVYFQDGHTAYASKYDFPTPDLLYAELHSRVPIGECLIIPHAHNPGDWQYADPDLERLVEIYSEHGTFEWFGQRYLNAGARLAFVGGSDNHMGRPGWGPMDSAYMSTRGLTAICANALTRQSIWRALVERRVYATTGDRILLDFEMDGHPMGSLYYTDDVRRGMEVSVAGQSGIHHLDILREGRIVRTFYGEPLPEGDAEGFWIAMHLASSSEPDGFARPLPQASWAITIRAKKKILHFRGEGLEPFDAFIRKDDHTLAYTGRTRGDVDVLLLQLGDEGTVEIQQENGGTILVRPDDVRNRTVLSMHPYRARHLDIPRRITFSSHVENRPQLHVTFEDSDPFDKETHYRVRVLQQNGQRAWSSPIWVRRRQSRKNSRQNK